MFTIHVQGEAFTFFIECLTTIAIFWLFSGDPTEEVTPTIPETEPELPFPGLSDSNSNLYYSSLPADIEEVFYIDPLDSEIDAPCEPEIILSELTVKELRKMARSLQISKASKMSKAALIAAIEEVEALEFQALEAAHRDLRNLEESVTSEWENQNLG